MAEEKRKPYMSDKDFLVEDELTVTITLHEYRSLVGFEAKHDAELSKLKNEKYKVEQENKRLKEKILSLTTECGDSDEEKEEW